MPPEDWGLLAGLLYSLLAWLPTILVLYGLYKFKEKRAEEERYSEKVDFGCSYVIVGLVMMVVAHFLALRLFLFLPGPLAEGLAGFSTCGQLHVPRGPDCPVPAGPGLHVYIYYPNLGYALGLLLMVFGGMAALWRRQRGQG